MQISFRKWIVVLTGVLLSMAPDILHALPQKVLYQGTLRRSGTIFTGNGTFLFRVTDAAGATEYWTSGSTVVAVTSGLFRYPLGVDNLGGTGLNSKPFANIPWALIEPYVEVTVDGILLSPREPLSSVPYALYLTTGDAFSVGGSTFVVAGGKVGIGTASPSDNLHVAANSGNIIAGGWGCGAGYVGIGFSGNLSSCMNYSLLGEGTHTYLNRPSGGNIYFREGNSSQLTLRTGGNLGIGTTSPQGRLEVRPTAAENYSLYVSSQNSAPILTVDKAGDVFIGAPDTHDLTSGQDLHVRGNVIVDGQFIGHTTAGSSVTFTSGGDFIVGTSTLVVTSGKVGIGTTNPNTKLQAGIHTRGEGALGFAQAQGVIETQGSSPGSYANLAGYNGILLRHNGWGAVSTDPGKRFLLYLQNTNGDLNFANDAFGTAMTISQTSNIGIGNTNPTGRLHVSSGTVLIDGGGSTSFQIGASTLVVTGSGNVGIGTTAPTNTLHIVGDRLLLTRRASNVDAAFHLTAEDSSDRGALALAATGGAFSNQASASDVVLRSMGGRLHLATDPAIVNPNTRLLIDTAGNVGIGSTNPGATRLWLQGSAGESYHLRVSSQDASGSLLVVSSNGYVGIGTTDPGLRLHVMDSSAGDGGKIRLQYSSGYATHGEIGMVQGPSNSDIWFGQNLATKGNSSPVQSNTGQVSWYAKMGGFTDSFTLSRIPAGGSAYSALFINGSGNVGIGLTNPASKMEVRDGDIRISTTSGSKGVVFQDGSTQYFSGKVINVTYFVDATRSVLGTPASVTFASFTVNKKSASSNLICSAVISGFGDHAGSMTQGWKLGSGTEVIAQGIMYSASTSIHGRIYPTMAVITGHATTGAQTMVFRYYTADSTTGNKPFVTLNPNSTDDARLGQTQSVYTVWEVEPQ